MSEGWFSWKAVLSEVSQQITYHGCCLKVRETFSWMSIEPFLIIKDVSIVYKVSKKNELLGVSSISSELNDWILVRFNSFKYSCKKMIVETRAEWMKEFKIRMINGRIKNPEKEIKYRIQQKAKSRLWFQVKASLKVSSTRLYSMIST